MQQKTLTPPRNSKPSKVILGLVAAAFIGAIVYYLVQLIRDPANRGDHLAHTLLSTVGLVVLLLPQLAMRLFRLVFPAWLLILYALFIFAAIFLGYICHLNLTLTHWDLFLHAFSAALLGAFGFTVLKFFSRGAKLPPFFVALFVFVFALAVGAIWEICEYTTDQITNGNLQIHTLPDGTPLVGHLALRNTIKDLVVDASGALLFAVVAFVATRRRPKTLDRLELKRLK